MNRGGFSWRRLLGISAAKARLSREIGIPLTRSGRRQKVGRALGCAVVIWATAGVAVAAAAASCSTPTAPLFSLAATYRLVKVRTAVYPDTGDAPEPGCYVLVDPPGEYAFLHGQLTIGPEADSLHLDYRLESQGCLGSPPHPFDTSLARRFVRQGNQLIITRIPLGNYPAFSDTAFITSDTLRLDLQTSPGNLIIQTYYRPIR